MTSVKHMLCPDCPPESGKLVVKGERAYCQSCGRSTKVHKFTITETVADLPKVCAYKDVDGTCAHPGGRSGCCDFKPVTDCQKGKFICFQCMKRVDYLFDDSRCSACTRMTPEEVRGESK